MRLKAETLVRAMEMALREAPDAAQIVAAESVVEAETKDHMNWELMSQAAEKLTGEEKKALTEACEEVEDEEDEHLYHTMGWTRELWIEALGMPAVLPPPKRKRTSRRPSAPRAREARAQADASQGGKKRPEAEG